MKRIIAVFIGVLLAVLIAVQDAFAQVPQSPPLPLLRTPRVSQGAKVTQVIGLSEATVLYHRPGVKGREIWGKLLPFGEVWRGSERADVVYLQRRGDHSGEKTAARDVPFPDHSHPKGLDRHFQFRGKELGTVYEPKYDTLKFTVTPETGPHEEWLSFSFTDLTPTSARVVLAWEKVRISFKVEFNTLGKIQTSVGTWQVLTGAARYALTEKVFSAEAMNWVDRSIAMDKNAWNLGTKAELLAAAGKFKEAIATGEEALAVGKSKDPRYEGSMQAKNLTKLIGEWKAK